MSFAPILTVFDVITDFLASDPTPQEILAYKLPPELEARAVELLERNRNHELSPEEEAEMIDFIRADDMITLLKAKMRRKISNQK